MLGTKTRGVSKRDVAVWLGAIVLLLTTISYWPYKQIKQTANALISTSGNHEIETPRLLSEDTLPLTFQNEIGMQFSLIRRGFFRMGSTVQSASDNEGPRHLVMITQPFYIGTYEVTKRQWQQVIGSQSVYSFPGHDVKTDDLPIESISWETAQSFIRRLNRAEGGAFYRLPTEAEWEYVARAGSSQTYSFGNNEQILRDYGWYSHNADRQPHPVGQLRPNAWGVYDMHGNVSEWVHDWYGPYDREKIIQDPKNPTGPSQGTYHIIRGGSWLSSAPECRSARRTKKLPGQSSNDIGFRLVRVLN